MASPEMVEWVKEYLEEGHTQISIRRLAKLISVSYGTAHTILRKKLKMFAYKVKTGQHMTVS